MKMDFFERIMIPEGIRIPILGGMWYRYLSKLARKRAKKISYDSLSLNTEERDHIITCTLTSFPDRIDTVQHTIKTLFTQSMKPDRIVLWLAKEEFEGRKLPESLLKLQEKGLEIRYCENMFGHKRYYKIIEEQRSNECIIMFDDDILFPHCCVERLYREWLKYPDCIICDRGQQVCFDGKDFVSPAHWSAHSKVGLKEPAYRILASPGGGCLLPPGALCEDACDPELIEKYAMKTDDIWLMFMAVQNDTKIIRTYRFHRIFILSETEQTVQLGRDAIVLGRYMETLAALKEKYPHAYTNMLYEDRPDR